MNLIDLVIEELKDSFSYNDYTILEELLGFIPEHNLLQVLPEENQKRYLKKSNLKHKDKLNETNR